MRVLLVHPPVCDPTMPPVALPLLAAVLRREGIDVSLVDANLEALDWLLESPRLGELEARVRRRFQRLEALRGLSHPQRLAWLALHDGLAAAASLRDRGPGRRGGVPAMTVEDAKVLLRGQREGFYEPARYGAAADTLEAALRLVSAAHAPLELDLRSWRTPFAFLAPGEVKADAAPERNPFHPWLDGVLCPRVEAARVGLVGISVVFPGQLQGAWSTAWALRRRFPSLVLVAGGPALTQRLIHLPRDIALRMLEPFDAAVLGEG
ncbi:MAG: B12-binding domain-containing radical SAM protein, partial [Deltaproteobacteria bacterium]|nr:B12-binding domain-containing radical SAM protein [Deltaproteobacteria bacterium]